MNSPESVLLIILGVALAIFLILSIVLIVIIIGIVKNISHITQKAELASDSLAGIALGLGKKVAPLALSAAAAAAMRKFSKSKK